jgi:hypothetical protein
MNFKKLSLLDKVIAGNPSFVAEMMWASNAAPVENLDDPQSFGCADANFVRLDHTGCKCPTPQPKTLWVNSQTGESGSMCMTCKGKI